MALVQELRHVAEQELVDLAVDWAVVHGITMRTREGTIDHAPVTLLPTPFPQSQLEKALAAQRTLNRLLHNLRLKPEYILSELSAAAHADPFTGRLLGILEECQRSPLHQSLSLSLHRTDYMLHDEAGVPSIRQVEINTISAAFAGLGVEPRRLHRFIFERFTADSAANAQRLPPNDARTGVAMAFATAVKEYVRRGGQDDAVVLMVVQPGENNRFDQRMLEFELWESHRISMRRHTLAELSTVASHGDNGTMTVNGREVALVYYRAGYRPEDHPTEIEWCARTNIEKSRAIKCPSLLDHLIGAKKMQQVLAGAGALETLSDQVSPDDMATIRSTFAGLYPLDDTPEGDMAAANALNSPEKFVLKPQREGGGNNLYDEEMQAELKRVSPSERSGYILMERLYPPAYPNLILRESQIVEGDVVSELGVFGFCLSDVKTREIVVDGVAGHLLRSKLRDVLDGGVASGRAVLDSPFLT